MNFGTQLRLNKKIKKKETIDKFISNINNFTLKCSYTFILPISAFEEWKYNLINEFEDLVDLDLNSKNCEN